MLIKPYLQDEEIVRCLKDAYKLYVATISFLAIGAITTQLFSALQQALKRDTF